MSLKESVRATMHYTVDNGVALYFYFYFYFYDPDPSVALKPPGTDPCEVEIHNAWPRGLLLAQQCCDVLDFHAERQLIATGYPGVEALLRQVTGAQQALGFDPTLRSRAARRPPLDRLGGSFAGARTGRPRAR